MTPIIASAASAAGHVEAYCSTGTSPGVARRVPVRLDLDHAGATDLELRYELHGPAHAPAVVVLGGISAGRHLSPTPLDPSDGWWPGVVGPGAALDPARLRLLGVDFVGGPSVPFAAGPPVTTSDQARALLAVLDAVGIEAPVVVGASYGGMVALSLAALAPHRVAKAVVLGAAHRPHPMAGALRALQRDVVRFGVEVGRPGRGLVLARALAMTTYRTEREFDQRFEWRASAHEGGWRLPVEAYLSACGERFAGAFAPADFVRLSESIDLHDVDPSAVRVPTTVVSFEGDRVVPPWLVEELVRAAPGVRRHVHVATLYGHDGFLKETRAVAELLGRELREEVVR